MAKMHPEDMGATLGGGIRARGYQRGRLRGCLKLAVVGFAVGGACLVGCNGCSHGDSSITMDHAAGIFGAAGELLVNPKARKPYSPEY